MAAVAEFMGAKIVEDSKRGSLEKLQRGQLTHGSAPYGSKYIDKRDRQNPSSFQINENQAPIVRESFERRVQKWRKYSIARELNSWGIPAAKGGPWNCGSIS